MKLKKGISKNYPRLLAHWIYLRLFLQIDGNSYGLNKKHILGE